MRRSRRHNTGGGAFSVSGREGERIISGGVGAALGVAQTWAGRLVDPGTVYVRQIDGRALYFVERDEEGVVWTTPAPAL